MKTVMAFGTFDILHPGHFYYLNKAKELGEHLTVVIARDSNVVKAKGRKPVNSEGKRLGKVKKAGIADEVVLGDEEDRFLPIEKKKPDVIALGYDQKADEGILRTVLERQGINAQIVRIGPFKTDVYKSSKLREKQQDNF